jgi:hypothetical protein
MICVQKMRMITKEHHTVYRAILMCSSGGGGGPAQKKIKKFGNFFQHVKKLLNFWILVNIKVAPAKLDHLGFYCKPSLI